MEGFCRGCLVKYNEPTDLVQYTEKNRRLYVYSTGLQVKRNDTFPFQLCKECYVNMKQSSKFKKQCRTADKRYKNYLALKESGEVNDFCTFLKNIENSFMFRLPLRSGNSTPAHQKLRDDDEESACTSIRNFMTDIIHADEIPDTEARIIREVIEEEADVMDESLDSIWLQDDASIDTDFRLDFSFSPFTTPQSVNSDRCNTPHKLRELVKSIKIIGKKENTENKNQNETLDDFKNNTEIKVTNSIISTKEDLNQNSDENYVAVLNLEKIYARQQNFYVEIENNEDHEDNVIQIEGKKDCTIENNLAAALNDTDKEFLLEDILKTPRICAGASGLSTPTINNLLFSENIDDNSTCEASTPTLDKILFGEKLDENGASTPKPGHYIEKYEVSEGDILDDFFQEHNKSFDLHTVTDENKQLTENEENILKNEPNAENIGEERETKKEELKYDLINAICITCDKKFKNPKYLKIHVKKMHKISLEKAPKVTKPKIRICDTCGHSCSDYSSFVKHIRSHETQGRPTCKICKLKCTTLSKLHTHKKTHVDPESRKKLEALKVHKYVCPICGTGVANLTSLKIHLQRHDKKFACFCAVCGRGFYRNHDLKVHMRTHNEDRPYGCEECGKKFSRTDTLNRHMKIHNDERPYSCLVCRKRFTRPSALNHHVKNSLQCLRSRLHDEIIKIDKKDQKRNKQPTYYCILDDDDPKLVVDEGNCNNQETNTILVEAEEDTLI